MMAGSWLAAWLANYAMNYTTPYQQIQGFFFGMIVLAAIGMWRITKPDA